MKNLILIPGELFSLLCKWTPELPIHAAGVLAYGISTKEVPKDALVPQEGEGFNFRT